MEKNILRMANDNGVESMTNEESGSIGDAVLVDAGDVDPESVLETAANHQPEGLTGLDAELDLPRSRAVATRVPRMERRR